jgi:hypothetical protein
MDDIEFLLLCDGCRKMYVEFNFAKGLFYFILTRCIVCCEGFAGTTSVKLKACGRCSRQKLKCSHSKADNPPKPHGANCPISRRRPTVESNVPVEGNLPVFSLDNS